MRISVIVPCVDEEVSLARSIERLQDLGVEEDGEILVVDGGSRDKTIEIAQSYAVRVICAPRGRAYQMNEGARAASGDWLLFLHADTLLTRESWRSWQDAITENIVGGAFARRFVPAGMFLSASARLADLRGRLFGVFLGDQALFVRRKVFWDLGAFDETVPFGEDLLFSLRMRKAGRTSLVGSPIQSSARRFDKRGPLRQTFLDLMLSWQLVRAHRPSRSEKRE